MDGRHGPETPPDRPPRDGTFEPVALTADRPRVALWIALVTIGLVFGIVDPWGWGAAPDRGRAVGAGVGPPGSLDTAAGAFARPIASVGPTVRPGTAGPQVADFCLDPSTWLVASVEVWRDQTVRVWRALEPATKARGPGDPAIPVTPLVSEGVRELGWCAPVAGGGQPVGAVTIDVWRVTPSGAVSVGMQQDRPPGAVSAFGALYGPPAGGPPDGGPPETRPRARPGRATPTEAWPDGRFVFRHRSTGGQERWFAIEVERRPRLELTP